MQTFKPPATQRHYDVCVIGSQLGGAVAGALLAKRGYRVLHIDHDGLGSGYQDGDWLLPYAPALLPHPRAFPAADSALAELGLATDLSRLLEPCAPDLQIILPRARLDLPHDAAARAREIAREWPREAASLEAGLRRLSELQVAANTFFKAMPPLPPTGWGERRAVSRAEKASPGMRSGASEPALPDHPLSKALEAAWRFMSHLDGAAPPLGLARLVGAALRGTFRLAGGYEGLRESIRKKITESRGELLGGEGAPAIAETLEFEGGKPSAVRLLGGGATYVARAFVIATDSGAVRRLIPPASAERKMSALLDRVQTRYQLLTVNLVVSADGLPPGLGEAALILRDPGGPAVMENAVLLQVLPARSPGKAEEASRARVLSAAAFVPSAARDLGEPHLLEVAGRIKAAVAEVCPFYERHLLKESVPALAAAKTPRGSRLSPHPIYEVAGAGTLGVTGLPPKTPWKNFFFAGREVLPGLGIEGEFHAGIQAAGFVTALLHRKDPLK